MTLDTEATLLNLETLDDSLLLDVVQVASLKVFGARATLDHNRSVGRPGPRWVKLSGRVFYKVADLKAFLATQAERCAEDHAARRARFEKARRGKPIAA